MRATQGNSVARTKLQKVAVLNDPVMEGRSKCKVDAGIPAMTRMDAHGASEPEFYIIGKWVGSPRKWFHLYICETH